MLSRQHFLFGLAAMLACLFLSNRADAELVGRWQFNETDGSIASDVLGLNDGNLAGDAAFVTGGISGNAVGMSKAGGGFVSFGDIFSFTSGNFTLILWVKTAAGDQQEGLFPLARHVTGTLNGYIVAINTAATYGVTGKAFFYMSNIPGGEIISTTDVNDGNWHQIAAVYVDGGQAELYVDGGSAEATGPALAIAELPVAGALHVGGAITGTEPQSIYDGEVDELQIYDHALSEADIQFLFLHPSLALGDFEDGFEPLPP